MKQSLNLSNLSSGETGINVKSHQPCIELKNVCVNFDGKSVLDNFSLTVQTGQKVILTGPSGRGKSTVLRCILGFVVPEKGTIKIFGESLNQHSVWRLRTFIGYVPQEPELGSGTVQEWLEGPFNFKANKGLKKNLDKIPDLFHQFLLPLDLLEKNVQTLSGGEKQRVAIVSAILLQRPVLLLDEPTSALDDMSRKKLAEFLSGTEITALVVSHESDLISIAHKEIKLG